MEMQLRALTFIFLYGRIYSGYISVLYIWQVPKHVLLHIIGRSKVKKQAIQRIIDTTVGEHVEKVTCTELLSGILFLVCR